METIEKEISTPIKTKLRRKTSTEGLSQPTNELSPSVEKQQNTQSSEKDAQKENEIKLKYAEEVHQYIREYIRLADQKSAFFFAATSALLAYTNKQGILTKWLTPPKAWTLIEALSFLTSISLLISILACLFVIIPRVRGSKRGIIFFKAIVEYSDRQEYANEVVSLSPSKLCEEKFKHAYDIASVCTKKYFALAFGLWSGGVAFLTTILLLIFS